MEKELFQMRLNKLHRVCVRITISLLFIVVMLMLCSIIFGANQQKQNSSVKVNYTRPYYTVTLNANGGSFSTTGGGGNLKASSTW